MTIQDIYEKYHVPPHLQMHMLRVTVVVNLIGEKVLGLSPDEMSAVLTASLFHDMWNILKFDMSVYPAVREPEGVAYRQGVQEQWRQYGATEHEATMTVASEVWLCSEALAVLDPLVTLPATHNAKTAWRLVKLCEYADGRVWPFGLVSLEERFEDLLHRDMKNFTLSETHVREKHKECLQALQSIEQELFVWAAFGPEDIDGDVVERLVEGFRGYEVVVGGE